MVRRFMIVLSGVMFVLSGCAPATPANVNQQQSNATGLPVKKQARVFSVSPVLQKPGSGSGKWNVALLPSNFTPIDPVPSGVTWQPMNFGQDPPLLAKNASGKAYLATDAGLWYQNRGGQRWIFIPGTQNFTPITAVTVTTAGAPVIADRHGLYTYISTRWIPIPIKRKGVVTSLGWTRDGALAVSLTTYPQSHRSSSSIGGPAPLPVNVMLLYDGKHWTTLQNTQHLQGLTGVSQPIKADAFGIHYIGLSPQGVPTLELMSKNFNPVMLQQLQGKWKALNMSSFPVSKQILGNYTVTRDVTWWKGKLIVSSPVGGAMEWNGSTWVSVGNHRGMTSNYHRTGTISAAGNDLFAEVKETIPPPPTTPSRGFNTLWDFQANRWRQIGFPRAVSGFVFGDPILSDKGDIAVEESNSWAGNHIWLQHHQEWHQIADGTGIFRNNDVASMKFAPNGRLTIGLVGPSSDNIYEWSGSKWTPILADAHTVLPTHFTNWFRYIWAPDGSLIVGVMNNKGYSVWRYKNGKWTDLGLHHQRPEFLFVTKSDTLFVVTGNYVCWKMQLPK